VLLHPLSSSADTNDRQRKNTRADNAQSGPFVRFGGKEHRREKAASLANMSPDDTGKHGADIKPPWWLKPMNKVFMTVMKVVPVKGPVVLTVPGRASGAPRSTPVTPFEVDGQRYVVGGFPKADWVRNARAAGTGTLTQGRRTEQVRLLEVPADQARPLLRQFPILVPTGVGFMKSAGLVTGPHPDEFEALAGRCAVFRLAPATGAGPA
jgi:deazaflavin-dependent oxidoreductase (nitroreductase family)